MPLPPRTRPRPPHRAAHTSPPPIKRAVVQPLDEREIDELQVLLDRVPQSLEALDVSMLDGFLCGVLLQPQRIPESRWLPHITDVDGRPLPAGFDASRLHVLVRRRHAELEDAIARRQWFDPWVFELQVDEVQDESDDVEEAPAEVDAVYPWVAGFATAHEFFPSVMQFDAAEITEPLALVYRYLDADDLEDADDLLNEIETLEPPADLAEAVEGLVRATLLLADVSRPASAPHASRAAPRQRPPRRR
ncbi:MAG: YecA family protein [Burkholderiales bacterium]|nr:YecA family protein [Burkholderiales bacterium]